VLFLGNDEGGFFLRKNPLNSCGFGLHQSGKCYSCARFSDLFKSSQGHALVRVAPGGADFSVLVLEDGDESDRVKAVFGPYPG